MPERWQSVSQLLSRPTARGTSMAGAQGQSQIRVWPPSTHLWSLWQPLGLFWNSSAKLQRVLRGT